MIAAGHPPDGLTYVGTTLTADWNDPDAPTDSEFDTLLAAHGGTALAPLRLEAVAATIYTDHRGVDYKTGLVGRLHKHIDAADPVFWYRGEVRRVEYWDSPAKNDLYLTVVVQYVRRANGLLQIVNPNAVWGDADFIGRRTTRTWYRTDGTTEPDIKVTDKTYNAVDAMREGERRRHNVIQQLAIDLLTMIVVTETATNPAAPTAAEVTEAEEIGTAYLAKYEGDIGLFYTTGYLGWTGKPEHQTNYDPGPPETHDPAPTPNITADNETWLDNDLALLGQPGVTIRDATLDALKWIQE